MKKNKTSIKLYCFSPPVMVATVIIEAIVILWVLYKYKLDTVGRLIVAALLALGLFQLSEYFVCTGTAGSAENWSRLGFVAIATLPVLGLHIIHTINKSIAKNIIRAGYSSMSIFILYFIFSANAFSGYMCTGNYVIFQIGITPAILFGMYYYGWLMTVLFLGYKWLGHLDRSSNARKATMALMVGYMVFLVPTAIANTVRPETRAGIPSIMCGFAVIFALILGLYIMPLVSEKRSSLNQ
jgi:hypothetical protein